MRIPCPFCGPRDLIEFTVAGEAGERPAVDAADLDCEAARAAFADHVYVRDNPAGRHVERWFHGIGCQSWLVVTRDTRTHRIEEVRLSREPAEASS